MKNCESKEDEYGYFKDRIVLAVGYGVSGKEITKLVKRQCGMSYVFDENKDLEVDKNCVSKKFHDVADIKWDDIGLVVLSPGVPQEAEIVKEAKKQGKEVIGEIEFAYRYSKGTILGITGTNGKTTTTNLLGNICSAYNNDTYTLGNIGTPFTSVADKLSNDSIVALELSSFQLETIKEFRPKVAAITNIAEDHLNRHKTMKNYIAAKFNICKNQSEGDYLILNIFDDYIVDYVTNNYISPDIRIIWFSSKIEKGEIEKRVSKVQKKMYDLALEGEAITSKKDKEEFEERYLGRFRTKRFLYEEDSDIYVYDEEKGIDEKLVKKEDIKILGKHNAENIMVAASAAYYIGVQKDIIAKEVSKFTGVEHRIEYVGKKEGITYYNDSKATNPDAAVVAAKAMDKPTVIMLGGSDKKVSFDILAKTLLESNVRLAVISGDCKGDIIKSLKKYNIQYIETNSFDESFETARKEAKEGEIVLLSPGCASFDEFKGFEERGKHFKELYNNI